MIRKRRPQKCSICHQIGHNKRKCKSNTNNTNNVNSNNTTIIEVEPEPQPIIIYDYHDSRNDEKEILLEREDYGSSYKKAIYKIEKHKLTRIWYDTSEECGNKIIAAFIDNKSFISVVAEPGVGKTNLIHYIYYYCKCLLPDDMIILNDRITILTGMSSKDFVEQTSDAITLRGKHEQIYHRNTFINRVKDLLKNKELLSDHLFIIDECHIANEKDMTIHQCFKRLGLTDEIIKNLKIKFIFISATPDVMLEEFRKSINSNEVWDCVELNKGTDYKGFKYWRDNKYMKHSKKYNLKLESDCIEFIKENIDKKNPKYHILRVKNNNMRENLIKIINEECWLHQEHTVKTKITNFEDLLCKPPTTHTVIFIKDYFRANKRLRLNPNIGIVMEYHSQKDDICVTAQGLIPRFFGYYSEDEVKDINVKFICNMDCINTYIELVNNPKFNPEGTKYRSRKLKVNEGTVQILKNSYVDNNLITINDSNNTNNTNKYKYDDDYNDINDVPESDWYNADDTNPNIIHSRIEWKLKDGKWCNSDTRFRTFNSYLPYAGMGVGGSNYILEYKDETSPLYIIRKLIK